MRGRKRVWINLHTRDESEAIIAAVDIERDPLAEHVSGLKLDYERFVRYMQANHRYTLSSAKAKKNTLKIFCDWLPKTASLLNIDRAQIQEWYEYLRKDRTESTAHGYILTVRSFFRWAQEVERVRVDNPAEKVRLAKWRQLGRREWVRKEMKDRLIAQAKGDIKFILFCGFDLGFRRNEICEARADWFDLKNGIVSVRKAIDASRLREGERPFPIKDQSERQIPMTKPLQAFLKTYLKGREPLDFALMPDVLHWNANYRYDFRRPFKDFMEAQEQPWITPHVMRHSFASILVNDNVSIYKVVIWMDIDLRTARRHYAKIETKDNDIHCLTSGYSPRRKRAQQSFKSP